MNMVCERSSHQIRNTVEHSAICGGRSIIRISETFPCASTISNWYGKCCGQDRSVSSATMKFSEDSDGDSSEAAAIDPNDADNGNCSTAFPDESLGFESVEASRSTQHA